MAAAPDLNRNQAYHFEGGLDLSSNKSAKLSCLKVELGLPIQTIEVQPEKKAMLLGKEQPSHRKSSTPQTGMQGPSYQEIASKAISNFSNDLKSLFGAKENRIADERLLTARKRDEKHSNQLLDITPECSIVKSSHRRDNTQSSKLKDKASREIFIEMPSLYSVHTPNKTEKSHTKVAKSPNRINLYQEILKNLSRQTSKSKSRARAAQDSYPKVVDIICPIPMADQTEHTSTKSLLKGSNSIWSLSEDSEHVAAKCIFEKNAAETSSEGRALRLKHQELNPDLSASNHKMVEKIDASISKVHLQDVDNVITTTSEMIGDLEKLIHDCNNSSTKKKLIQSTGFDDGGYQYVTLGATDKPSSFGDYPPALTNLPNYINTTQAAFSKEDPLEVDLKFHFAKVSNKPAVNDKENCSVVGQQEVQRKLALALKMAQKIKTNSSTSTSVADKQLEQGDLGEESGFSSVFFDFKSTQQQMNALGGSQLQHTSQPRWR